MPSSPARSMNALPRPAVLQAMSMRGALVHPLFLFAATFGLATALVHHFGG